MNANYKTLGRTLFYLLVFLSFCVIAVTLDHLVGSSRSSKRYDIPDPRDKPLAVCLDKYSTCEEKIPYETCLERFNICTSDVTRWYKALK